MVKLGKISDYIALLSVGIFYGNEDDCQPCPSVHKYVICHQSGSVTECQAPLEINVIRDRLIDFLPSSSSVTAQKKDRLFQGTKSNVKLDRSSKKIIKTTTLIKGL